MMRRVLTFLDTDDNVPSDANDTRGFILAYSFLTAACLVVLLQALYETRMELYGKHSIRILLPWLAFAILLENATWAYDVSGHNPLSGWAGVVYVTEATVAPSLLLSTFDVTYLIHKTRSIPFCGLYDGQTRIRDPRRTMALKMFMRGVALCLLILSLVVNFNLCGFQNHPSFNAGRAGWSYVVTEPLDVEQVQVILALVPMAIVTLACVFFSLALWRYGTTFSMVVHSSPFNPWFSPFFGTIALAGGQWFGPKWFSLLSNLGIFVFLESILLLLIEINKDLEAATELTSFLNSIEAKRKERSYIRKKKKNSQQQLKQTEDQQQQQVDEEKADHIELVQLNKPDEDEGKDGENGDEKDKYN